MIGKTNFSLGFCTCRHNLWLAQDKFLIIFSQGCVFGFRLIQKKNGRGIAKKYGFQFSALRLRGVRWSRTLCQKTESLIN
jgi:hypothetical protein